MSRCFPYPPPGYAGKSASNEALICTIKPQRKSEKTKSEKKDKRKEKKEKKREDKANGTISSEKKKILKDEKIYDAHKYGKYPDVGHIKQQSSYELMEKSSLTEEHGKPCCSSDSTENSGKRKRQSSPLPGNNNARNSGTVIRIVLNSRKKDDCPTSTASRTPSLSVKTGKLDSLSQNADVAVKTPASKLRISPPKINSTQQLTISSNREKLPCPTSNTIQNLTVTPSKEKLPDKKSIDQGSTSKTEKKLPRRLRKYNALFENFALPSMEVEAVDNDDDDWLFGSKKEEAGQPPKRSKLCKEEVVNCGIPALQPKAQFLGDVDIYALPFTVPF